MNLFRRYFIVILSGISLIFGIQIPNFIGQYEQRIDAHLVELQHSLSHYQSIAARNHQGNLQALIDFHKRNSSSTIREEGVLIADLYTRKQRFSAAQAALKGALPWKVIHIVTAKDRELLNETLARYSYAVPLNQDAIISGVSLTMLTIMVLEFLFGLLGYLGRLLMPWTRDENSHRPLPIIQRREPRLPI